MSLLAITGKTNCCVGYKTDNQSKKRPKTRGGLSTLVKKGQAKHPTLSPRKGLLAHLILRVVA